MIKRYCDECKKEYKESGSTTDHVVKSGKYRVEIDICFNKMIGGKRYKYNKPADLCKPCVKKIIGKILK